MWRRTMPQLWMTIRARKGQIAVVVLGGFISGLIATAKSTIESAVITRVADAISGHEFDGAWTTPLRSAFSASGDSADLTQRFTDLVLAGADLRAGIVLYVVISFLGACLSVWATSAREDVTRNMFVRLYERGLRSAFTGRAAPGMEDDEPGGLAGAIQQGARSVAGAYTFLVEAAQYLFTLATVVLLMAGVSWAFVAWCLGLTAFFALLSWDQGRRLGERREAFDEQRRRLFAFTDDVLVNRDVLLAHERRDTYVEALGRASHELATVDRALSVRERVYNALVGLIQDFGQIGILAIALLVASRGADFDRVGETYFYVSIFARLMSPIRSLLSGYDDVRRSMSASRTLVSLLADHTSPTASPAAGVSASVSGVAARFTDVVFRYSPDDDPVLDGCTFGVPEGGVTLLVGRSGSGKTTISRILLGFLRPQSGAVEVLHRSVDAWDHAAMLERMSYLAQSSHVIGRSVRENLFGAPDITEDDLRIALTQAGLAETSADAAAMLDRDARDLSEGQKQRLALARILADRSPLVVLDEPLAGVDAFTFQEVRPALAEWLDDPARTVILISHRLAFASSADHVVVLGRRGVVEEEGSPARLMSQDGRFAALLRTARAELEPR
jgi:ABC-type multidrug transport system fused ATPase/permease subunit